MIIEDRSINDLIMKLSVRKNIGGCLYSTKKLYKVNCLNNFI